jgi:hypothetical protein
MGKKRLIQSALVRQTFESLVMAELSETARALLLTYIENLVASELKALVPHIKKNNWTVYGYNMRTALEKRRRERK